MCFYSGSRGGCQESLLFYSSWPSSEVRLNECAIRLVGSQSSLPEFAKFTVADILTGLLVFRPLTTIPVTGFLTFREEFYLPTPPTT